MAEAAAGAVAEVDAGVKKKEEFISTDTKIPLLTTIGATADAVAAGSLAAVTATTAAGAGPSSAAALPASQNAEVLHPPSPMDILNEAKDMSADSNQELRALLTKASESTLLKPVEVLHLINVWESAMLAIDPQVPYKPEGKEVFIIGYPF